MPSECLEVPDDVGALINTVSLSIENGHGKTLTSSLNNKITVTPTLKSFLIRTGGYLRSEINKPSNNDIVLIIGIIMFIVGISFFGLYFVRRMLDNVLL